MSQPASGVEVESLHKRYGYKLAMSLLTPVAGAVISAVVPRALGPASYGVYTFLLGFFTSVIASMEGGTSVCLYNRLSARPTDNIAIGFYAKIAATMVGVLSLFLLVAFSSELHASLWAQMPADAVVQICMLAFMIWLSDIAVKICDAKGLTVRSETCRFAHKLLMVGGIVALASTSLLNLSVLVLVQFFGWIGLIAYLGRVIAQRSTGSFGFGLVPQTTSMLREFWHYSAPLAAGTVIYQGAVALESWMLITFSGHEEQGFFGLSQQVSITALVFTTALIPLLFREFSQAVAARDQDRMQRLFLRSVKGVVSIAMVFSGFLMWHADYITQFFGGGQFHSATVPVAIMLFYPVHQTYGQLCNSIFFAAGKTKVHLRLGFMTVLISLPMAFVLLSPADWGGFHFGATGQAVKAVLVQVIITNFALLFACRICGIRYLTAIRHQIAIILVLTTVGLAARGLADMIPVALGPVMAAALRTSVAGVFYLLVLAGLVVMRPSFFGLTVEDLHRVRRLLVRYLPGSPRA